MARNRILVVEDDDSINQVIVKNLTAAGYAVTSYMDGAEAASAVSTDADFDLALLDIMLPGMDGFELMDTMKHANIPVIYLTAKNDVDSKVQGLRGGAELAVSRVYLMNANDPSSPVAPEEMDYAYLLCCARRLEGVPNAKTSLAEGGYSDAPMDWNAFWKPCWDTEVCYVCYGGGGISNLMWQGPMKTCETVVEDSKLLPFETVKDVFDKMIGVVNQAQAGGKTLQRIAETVDRIELCPQRVRGREISNPAC